MSQGSKQTPNELSKKGPKSQNGNSEKLPMNQSSKLNPQSTNWNPPPRTHSAPPELIEQKNAPHPAFFPEKTTINHYIPQYYYPYPPPIPVSQAPVNVPQISLKKQSKAIPIIDPNTGKEKNFTPLKIGGTKPQSNQSTSITSTKENELKKESAEDQKPPENGTETTKLATNQENQIKVEIQPEKPQPEIEKTEPKEGKQIKTEPAATSQPNKEEEITSEKSEPSTPIKEEEKSSSEEESRSEEQEKEEEDEEEQEKEEEEEEQKKEKEEDEEEGHQEERVEEQEKREQEEELKKSSESEDAPNAQNELKKEESTPSHGDSRKQKYIYYDNPDGWRPDKEDGERKYSSKFLIQFKEICGEKPQKMQFLSDIAANKFQNEGKELKRSGSDHNLKKSLRNSKETSQRSPGPDRKDRKGLKESGERRLKKQPSKSKLVATPAVPPLTPTQNRWESSRNKNISSNEKILQKVTGYLNRLTEEKFNTLSQKILDCGITNSELLRGVIKLIFEKAILEPKFSAMYAELCKRLEGVKLEDKSDEENPSTKQNTFKRLLLNRCQEEFEKTFCRKEEEKKTPEIDPSISREDRIKLEEEETIKKKKILGNITFIGELFKIKMLTAKIMHECISTLLGDPKTPNAENIEALCRLLTTIGKSLEGKSKEEMSRYFVILKELSENQSLPARNRFMLDDLIELRNNSWTPRNEVKPPSSVNKARVETPRQPNKIKTPSSSNDEWKEVVRKNPYQYTKKINSGTELRPQKPNQTQDVRIMSKSSEIKITEEKQKLEAEIPPEKEELQEDLEDKINLLLEEYLSSKDSEEAIACITDLHSPSCHPDIVFTALSKTLEMKENDIHLIIKLFAKLKENNIFTSEDFKTGFARILQDFDDLVIDIPKSPEFMATFITSAVLDQLFELSFIEEAFKPLVNAQNRKAKASELLSEVIDNLLEELKPKETREMIKKSNLDLTKFFADKNEIPNFLDEKSKEFTDLFPEF